MNNPLSIAHLYRLILFIGCASCFAPLMLVAQTSQLTINPTAFNISLEAGDSAQYELQIGNNTAADLPIAITGATLLSNKKMHVTALSNGSDIAQEYANTIAAINTYFDNYTLSELNSYDPATVNAALQNTDVLLIPEQEDCNDVGWLALATTIQNFAQNGGTVIVNGTINQCIFNLGLFSGLYLGNYNGITNIEAPDDPLLQGIIPPYTAQIVSYYYTIFDSDWTDILTYEGNTVAGYRNIGTGKVILIGHDYMFSNGNMKRLIANAFYTANVNNQAWLYINDDADTLAANETSTYMVEFNAKNLFAGVYTQDLAIYAAANPDPIIVPCSLTVNGTAQYAINTPSHDFGEIPLSTTADYTFLIANNGTADLVISDIFADSDAYLISPDNAVVPPTQAQALSVTFAPPAVGSYNTMLTFITNIGTYSVALNGVGIAAPAVMVSPSSLEATLQSGESTTLPLVISNNGENVLNFSVDTTLFSAAPRILAYTNGIDLLGGYNNVLSILNSELGASNYTLSEINTSNAAELAAALANADIFLVPPITDLTATNTFSTLGGVLQSYAANGGKVIFLGSLLSLGQAPATVSGLFSGDFGLNPVGNCEVVAPAHPIVAGVPSSYAPTSVSPIGFSNSDIVRIVTQPPLIPLLPEGDIVAYRNIGTGKAIYIGSDYSSYNYIDELLLINTIRWVSNAATIWLTSSPTSGTVSFPAGQSTVNITLDASGLAPGIYQTTINIATNDPQNPTISIPVTLTVLPGAPTAIFTADVTETCSGIVNFSDLSDGSPISWLWDFGDGNSSTLQNPSHTYENDGTYSVSLTVCNAIGCNEQSEIAYIEVGLSPDCAIAVMPENNVFIAQDCAGTLSDSGGLSGDYEVGNEGVVTIAPVGATFVELTFTAFNYTTSGLPFPIPGFDHILTIYDGADTLSPVIGTYTGTQLPNTTGVILSSGGAITLKENTAGFLGSILPAASGFAATWSCQIITEVPTAQFTQSQANPCSSTIAFNSTATQYPNSWQWNFGDGTTSNLANPTHTYLNNGTYSVTLEACNIIGCSEVATQTVLIDDLISVDFSSPPSINIGQPALLQSDFVGATQIVWDYGDGQTAIGSIFAVHDYDQAGTYTITLTVTNTAGCTAQASHTITVIDPSVNTQTIAHNLPALAPNPFQHYLQVNIPPLQKPISLQLCNAWGQCVYSQTLQNNETIVTIDTAPLPVGVYMLWLETEQGQYKQKVLKVE
jgi:PKD repeat protein